MSRTPDFTTPVEDMSIEDLTSNLEALLSASIEACDIQELMTIHTALGGARHTVTETCDGCGGEIIPDDVEELSFVPENGLCAMELPQCHAERIHGEVATESLYVMICSEGGIPEVGFTCSSLERMKRYWNLHLAGDFQDKVCDSTEVHVSKSFEQGYFSYHKSEYRWTCVDMRGEY